MPSSCSPQKKPYTVPVKYLVLGFTPTSFILITPLVNIRTTGFNIKPLHFAHAQYNHKVRTIQKGKRLFPNTARIKMSLLSIFSVFSTNINYILSDVKINSKFRMENGHLNATFFCVSQLSVPFRLLSHLYYAFPLQNSLKDGRKSIWNERVYQFSHAAILKQSVGTLRKLLVMRQFRGCVHRR